MPKTIRGWLWAFGIFGLVAYLVSQGPLFKPYKINVPDCDKLRGQEADACWAYIEREYEEDQEWRRSHWGR